MVWYHLGCLPLKAGRVRQSLLRKQGAGPGRKNQKEN